MGSRDDESAAEQPTGRGVSWSEPVSWDPTETPGQRRPEPHQQNPAVDRQPLGSNRGGGPIMLALLAAALVVAAIAVAALLIQRQHGVDGTPAAVASSTTSAATTASTTTAAPVACMSRMDGQVVHGDGPGGTSSGPDAILGFQHAYYVERSGARARDFAAPNGAVPDAQVIQSGIDSVPMGTTHCLAITPQGPDQYGVELTETRLDGTVTVYKQVVATVVEDGKTLVESINLAAE